MVDDSDVRDPEWLAALCPRCGRALQRESLYVTDEARGLGLGYLLRWFCPGRDADRKAGERPCDYTRVL